MSEFLLLAFLIVLTSMGLNKCAGTGASAQNGNGPGQVKAHLNAPITYVMAARDPFNPRYVINPYRQNERLFVGEAVEGTVLLDPAGGPYVVGPR